MKYYPFVKCLCPRKIHNPYNHQDMLVPCGQCEACCLRKSSHNTLRVQLEDKNWLYTRFITLTYANHSIPRMHLEPNDSGDYDVYDNWSGDYMFDIPDFNISDYVSLCNKCESNSVPFLRKYDLQCFFKRLRKYFDDLSKKCNIPFGKIRYFACGEYGPKHFRPHYHIILWTNCEQIASEIGEAVSTCWQLGRVSTEIPFSDVSRYVAQYVNSSCPLPSLLKKPQTRPFSVHSLHLGESFFQAAKEEVYGSRFTDIVKRCSFVSNNYSEVFMWRSLKTYYFPRCKGYDVLTSSERYDSYMLIERLYERFPRYKTESLSAFTEFLLRLFRKEIELYQCVTNSFLSKLAYYCGADFLLDESDEVYESVFRSLYMILRLSKHFIEFVCNGDSSYWMSHYRFQQIEEFWKDNELFCLGLRFQGFQDSDCDIFESEEEYSFLFTQEPEDIINTQSYKTFKAERKNMYYNSMKHKRQNDANRIFEKI